MFYLIFPDHGLLQGPETAENKTTDNRGLLTFFLLLRKLRLGSGSEFAHGSSECGRQSLQSEQVSLDTQSLLLQLCVSRDFFLQFSL